MAGWRPRAQPWQDGGLARRLATRPRNEDGLVLNVFLEPFITPKLSEAGLEMLYAAETTDGL